MFTEAQCKLYVLLVDISRSLKISLDFIFWDKIQILTCILHTHTHMFSRL